MKHLYSIIFLFLVVSFISAKDKYNGIAFSTDSKFIYDVCLSVDRKVIVCSDNNTLKAFTVENKELLGNFSGGHRSKVLCVAISADGTMVASGGSDSNVVVWDFNTHTIIQRITFATGKITSIKFSPDNRFILFGCSNSRAYLYNVKEYKKVNEFDDQQLDITSVAFSSDGSLIAIAGGDKVIRLYNTSDFQLKSKLKGHTNWVRSISFYNHDKNLMSCGDDKKVIQWNLSTLAYKKKMILFKSWILCVDIDDEIVNRTNMYVFGTMNGSIRINYSLGSYGTKLSSPISKVIFLPNKSGLIEIVAATLGSSLIYLSAANMQMSK